MTRILADFDQLSTALYEYSTNRVTAQFRGSLVALIYRKTLRINPSSTADAEAITLMSADTDRISLGLNILHESYASVIQLGISLWILWLLIGDAMAASTIWLCCKFIYLQQQQR